MGLYDTFHGKCPFCNVDYMGQTKLFACEMLYFEIEKPLAAFDYGDMRLEMKERCIDCNKHPVAVIKDGIFVGFEKDKPTNREGCFGTTLQKDEVDELLDKIVDEVIKRAMG